MQFLAADDPAQTAHLSLVGRLVIADFVHGVAAAPEVFGNLLLHADRQTAACDVSVAHRVTVVEAVEDDADLTVVFVGVMFRMTEAPVIRRSVVGPVGFLNAEMTEHVGSAFAEPFAHFTLTVSDALEQILQEGSVAVFDLLPRNGVVFFFGKNFLPETLDVHLLEVAVELTVVAPYAEVIHCLDADHGSMAGGRKVALGGNLWEDDAAEVQRHTGLFGHLIDVIAGGGFFVFNDGVAAQRAGVAAVVANLNL